MKFSLTLFALSSGLLTVWGQTETDDMYFTGMDRKLEVAVRPKTNTYTGTSAQELASAQSPAFDGQYSGRTINPDYDPAALETEESGYSYFNPTYAPMGVNSSLYGYGNNWNAPNNYSAYGSGFGSPWGYGNNAWGNYYDPFNSWGSYGMMGLGYGSGFGNRWYGYGSGCYSCWSLGSSFGWGNSGWFNSSFGMPMYGFGGWGGGWYNQNNFYYGSSFDNQPRLTYGRRPSRSTNYANDAREPVRRNNMIVGGSTSRSTASGRSAASPANTYYQRGWRQDQNINPRPTPAVNSSTSSPWNSSRSGFSNSGNDNSGWRNSGSGFSSGGSRSGGFSSPGGSSGGSSAGGRRGRN